MVEHSRNAPSVIYWSDTTRAVLLSLGRAVREIWHGIDTWGAITQGVIPMSGHQQEQFAVRGDIDALTARANAGDEYAAALLARLLADRGDAR